MQAVIFEEARRARMLIADEKSVRGTPLGELWSELVGGKRRLVDWFLTPERCLMLIGRGARVPLEGRQRVMLEAVLLGLSQKHIALELCVAPSTVATSCKHALEYFGIPARGSKAPMLLVNLVHACRGLSDVRVARCSSLDSAEGELLVVSTTRPELRLANLLTQSEYEVTLLFVEGCTHAQIAAGRGTSPRTIANQLASVFRTLNVSGRAELLALLATSENPVVPSLNRHRPVLERSAGASAAPA